MLVQVFSNKVPILSSYILNRCIPMFLLMNKPIMMNVFFLIVL